MSRFLDTRGERYLSPYICDRCSLRGKFSEMVNDPDTNLWVHRDCADESDPWRLPPRVSDNVTVPNPRRDVNIADPQVVLSDELGNILVSPEGWILTP